MTTLNEATESNALMSELNFGCLSDNRKEMSSHPNTDNRKPISPEKTTNSGNASNTSEPAIQTNVKSNLKPIQMLTEQDLLNNSAGPPASSISSGATSIPLLSHELSRAERHLHELFFKGDHRAPPGIPPSTVSESTKGDGRAAGTCKVNLQESFQRAMVNCAVKRRPDVTSPPVLPFFLQQGMLGEEQAAPTCDGAAEKVCTSPLPATVPAPAVSFSYASVAARPSTSSASGASSTIGAAAARIPESDVSKVNLFDSFARAIANRPVPGPVESPPVPKCLVSPIPDFSTILLNNARQRSAPLPPGELVEPALFRTPEAVVLTVSEVNAPAEVDTSQVQMTRRRREAARKAAAHRSKVHVTERVLGREAKQGDVQTAQASVAPLAPQGGPQVETPSSSAVTNKTPRDLNEAARTTTSPLDTCRTVSKATYAMEASTPNKASPAVAAARATRPPDSGGKDEGHAWEVPAPKKAGPRKDWEIFVARPQDAAVVREWAATPIDVDACRIGLVLDEKIAPVEGTRTAWVVKTIEEATRAFVARRENKEGESQKVVALQRQDPDEGSTPVTSARRPSAETHSESKLSRAEKEWAVTGEEGVESSLASGPPRADPALTQASQPEAVRPPGTPPSAQAEGEGPTDGNVGRHCATAQGRRRRPENRSTPTRSTNPEGADSNNSAQPPAPPSSPPVSPSLRDILTGNPFAALACEPEIGEGPPQVKAEHKRRAARAREQGPLPPHERHRRPHTLADHVPVGGGLVSRETEKNKKKEQRRRRRQRAREERAAALEQAGGLHPVGMDGMVSGHVPGGFRLRHAYRSSRPFTVTVRDRPGGNGLEGFVTVRVEALQQRVARVADRDQESRRHRRQKERPVLPERIDSSDPVSMEGRVMEHGPGGLRTSRRGWVRAKPLEVSPQAVHRSKGLTGLAGTVIAEHRSPSQHVNQGTRRAPSPKPARASSSPAARPSDAQLVGTGTAQPTGVGEDPSRASPSALVDSECGPERTETSSARLQLVIDLGGRSVAVQVLESDLLLVSQLNLVAAEKAMEWTVATALRRALGLPNNAPSHSMEPVLHGRRVPGCCAPDSWASLALFMESGGQYKAERRLRGGGRQIHPPPHPPTHASPGQA